MMFPPEIIQLFQWVGAALAAAIILIIIPLVLGKTMGEWLSDLVDWLR
jgi:hypothetical protein